MDTVTLFDAEPSEPLQVSVYVVAALSGSVASDPLVASEPDHPPDAVQDATSFDDQVSVEVPPFATLVGLALRDTLGVPAATVTVADCEALPPGPVQVRTYLVVAFSAAVLIEPLVASDPLQPPDPVHAVAWVEVQVSRDFAPLFTVLGLAVKVTAGAAGVTETVAD
jgi:hypothetical protein